MKKIFLVSFVLSFFVVFSCQDVKNARKIADEFYKYRQNQQNDKAPSLCSQEFLDVTSEEEFVDMLDYMDSQFGELLSYSSNNFSVKTVNGNRIASFTYKVKYDNKTTRDSIVLIKKSDDFKIMYYQYSVQ